METLCARLESVQEELLMLYEADSSDIENQIKHWSLMRKEAILHNFARRKGIYRLGYHTVMPLQASYARATEAIEMMLHLDTLKDSKWGKEPWTLGDTSRERWMAAPQYCFKKDGETVEVQFDNEPENTMLYTMWRTIYHQSDTGWEKAAGHVDHNGCYYYDGDVRMTYVDFAEEAKKYGRTGEWEVHCKTHNVSPVASVSSTTGGRDLGPECEPDSRGSEQHEVLLCPESPANERQRHDNRKRRQPRTSTPCCKRSRGDSQDVPQGHNRQGDNRGGDREQHCNQENNRRSSKLRRGRPATPERSISEAQARNRRCVPDSSGSQRHPEEGRRPTGEEEEQNPRLSPPADPALPAEEAQGSQNSARQQRRRNPHRSPAEPCHLPILIFRGPHNPLKCWRYRVTKYYSQYFKVCSKTWSWVAEGELAALGRLTVAFDTAAQRSTFLANVPIPSHFTTIWGSVSAL